jgi:hypothetical protein
VGKGKIKGKEPYQGKLIKLNNSGDQKIDYPVFCFRHLHPNYSLEVCESEDRERLIERLYLLSKMSWQDIQLTNKHGFGSEKIRRESIKPAIPQQISDDVTFFLALRYNGKKPIVGFRNGSIFHLVYIDYNFSVYNHG